MQRHLGRFVTDLDIHAIARDLGRLGVVFTVVMLVPCVVALVVGEWAEALAFGVTAATAAAFARFTGWFEAEDLKPGDALVVCALAYAAAATLGGAPFLLYVGPVDAVFEAMSGFTTTGFSVLDLTDLPTSMGFYRGWIQFVGGAGIITLWLAILSNPGTAARQLSTAERGETLGVASILKATRTILVVYTGLTVAVWVGYGVGGMSAFDGLVHAMSTTSTGGLSPYTENLGRYADRPVVQITAALGMTAGAITFPLYVAAWRDGPRRLFGDIQVQSLFGLIAVTTVLLLWTEGGMWRSVLHAVSAATTTGFSVDDPAGWSDSGKLVTIPVMLVGGATGSSAGGLKLLRAVILVSAVQWVVWRALLPDARVSLTVRGVVVSEREFASLLALFALYAVLFGVGGLLLTFDGVAGVDALFESASALATTGLSAGGTAQSSWFGRIVLTVLMWAGRLETLPLIVLLYRVARWATHPRSAS